MNASRNAKNQGEIVVTVVGVITCDKKLEPITICSRRRREFSVRSTFYMMMQLRDDLCLCFFCFGEWISPSAVTGVATGCGSGGPTHPPGRCRDVADVVDVRRERVVAVGDSGSWYSDAPSSEVSVSLGRLSPCQCCEHNCIMVHARRRGLGRGSEWCEVVLLLGGERGCGLRWGQGLEFEVEDVGGRHYRRDLARRRYLRLRGCERFGLWLCCRRRGFMLCRLRFCRGSSRRGLRFSYVGLDVLDSDFWLRHRLRNDDGLWLFCSRRGLYWLLLDLGLDGLRLRLHELLLNFGLDRRLFNLRLGRRSGYWFWLSCSGFGLLDFFHHGFRSSFNRRRCSLGFRLKGVSYPERSRRHA